MRNCLSWKTVCFVFNPTDNAIPICEMHKLALVDVLVSDSLAFPYGLDDSQR